MVTSGRLIRHAPVAQVYVELAPYKFECHCHMLEQTRLPAAGGAEGKAVSEVLAASVAEWFANPCMEGVNRQQVRRR